MLDDLSTTQRKHLFDLKMSMWGLLDAKYRRGANEHGGDLLDMPPAVLLDEAIGEAIDQLVYLLLLKQKLGEPTANAKKL